MFKKKHHRIKTNTYILHFTRNLKYEIQEPGEIQVTRIKFHAFHSK